MAVIAMWMCDRDKSMFTTKKEADAHDKMLELAEQFTLLVGKHLSGVKSKEAEEFGILLAQNKDLLVTACKGKPDVLEEVAEVENDIVTPITAAK